MSAPATRSPETPEPAPGPVRPDDLRFMRMALKLAERGRGRTSPNPMVGAVVVHGGKVIARGYHQRAGLDHAEVAALRTIGMRAEGATLYSTLEPCCHQGRTGPCTEAILAAGIRRVVVGAIDPNPRVHLNGVARLQQAGLEVTVGVLADDCARVNEAFAKHVTTGLPFVVMKAAISLDGRLAPAGPRASAQPDFLTGEPARRLGPQLRDDHDAVLVGAGTVLADDPALTTRLERGPGGRAVRDALRVVLDGRLSTPPTARLLREGQGRPLILAEQGAADPERVRALEAAGAEVALLPGVDGRLSIEQALRHLGGRGVTSVLVEGGASVHGQLWEAAAVDRALIFVAPLMLGETGVPLAAFAGPGRATDAVRLAGLTLRRVGDDILLCGAPAFPRPLARSQAKE
jgi:diaminohydroxyphosphoribosylaminopyrimidine deaminase/5-amino-6-(5-phosphoribosylamino)uracil reductase